MTFFKIGIQFLLEGCDFVLLGKLVALKLRNLSLKFRIFRLQISDVFTDWQLRRLEERFKRLRMSQLISPNGK